MAQENQEVGIQGSSETEMNTNVGSKLNVHAPEFVPRSQTQKPVSGYFYPYLNFIGNGGGGMGLDWFYYAEQEPVRVISDCNGKVPNNSKSTNDVLQKIVKQVEYQFSDANLVSSDSLVKLITKDPEGYVPISSVTSLKKIKTLGANNQMLTKALRASSKLVVSEDGKKVRRKQLFQERDKEELQSRTVMVENLPEDYSLQNLGKIFGVVGRVKNIRVCHPQESCAARSSKGDVLISNKLHALVEFESVDQAEKAVEKLNDERNWRKGLHVRMMLRRSPKSVIRSRRSDYDHFDMDREDNHSPHSESMDPSQLIEQPGEQNVEDNQSGGKKLWIRGRGKSHGPVQNYSGQSESSGKLTPRGPRMPDGTRGFTMGRGKPLAPIPAI